MPYGKKPYRQRKAGRRTRKKRTSRPQTRLGWPAEKVTKFRYVDTFTLDIGAGGAISSAAFRANGCYDPDVAAGGHQPMMWDQWTALYNHYVVLGSKISIQVYDPVVATTTPQIIGIMLNDDTTFPTTWQTVLEQGKCNYQIVSGSADYPKTVTSTYSAKNFFNVVDVKDNLDRIGAGTGADPSEVAFFNVFALPYDGGSDLGPIRCLVTLDYIVSFSEPKDQVGS